MRHKSLAKLLVQAQGKVIITANKQQHFMFGCSHSLPWQPRPGVAVQGFYQLLRWALCKTPRQVCSSSSPLRRIHFSCRYSFFLFFSCRWCHLKQCFMTLDMRGAAWHVASYWQKATGRMTCRNTPDSADTQLQTPGTLDRRLLYFRHMWVM